MQYIVYTFVLFVDLITKKHAIVVFVLQSMKNVPSWFWKEIHNVQNVRRLCSWFIILKYSISPKIMHTKETKADYLFYKKNHQFLIHNARCFIKYFAEFLLVGCLLLTFWQTTAATRYVIKISKKAGLVDKLQILLRLSIVDHWGILEFAQNCLNFLWCALI